MIKYKEASTDKLFVALILSMYSLDLYELNCTYMLQVNEKNTAHLLDLQHCR